MKTHVHGENKLAGQLNCHYTDIMTEMAIEQIPGPLTDVVHRVARGAITYLTEHGQRVAAVVPVQMADYFDEDQAWFWMEEWQAGEREVEKERQAGPPNRHYSGEEFIAMLEANR